MHVVGDAVAPGRVRGPQGHIRWGPGERRLEELDVGNIQTGATESAERVFV